MLVVKIAYFQLAGKIPVFQQNMKLNGCYKYNNLYKTIAYTYMHISYVQRIIFEILNCIRVCTLPAAMVKRKKNHNL